MSYNVVQRRIMSVWDGLRPAYYMSQNLSIDHVLRHLSWESPRNARGVRYIVWKCRKYSKCLKMSKAPGKGPRQRPQAKAPGMPRALREMSQNVAKWIQYIPPNPRFYDSKTLKIIEEMIWSAHLRTSIPIALKAQKYQKCRNTNLSFTGCSWPRLPLRWIIIWLTCTDQLKEPLLVTKEMNVIRLTDL